MIASKRLRGAAYIRYSSGKQEGSDSQQEGEIRRLAEREGVEIVATYCDRGISGDTGREHRPEFAQMLDAVEAGKYDAVLAWDTSRLGRQDSADGTDLLRACKQSGTVILTCRDGRIDPRESMGRLQWAFSAEGNHMENRRRAYNVVRGQMKNAESGNRNGAKPPYGFDRGQYDAAGKLVRVLGPKQYVDCRDHHVRLVPSTDPGKLAAVRYIFRRFATADVSMRQIARELDAKGYPGPTGVGWSAGMVAKILRNPAYCGDSRWADQTRRGGKYLTVAGGGEIVSIEDGKPAGDAMLVKNTHKGIVTRKVWRAAARKLARRGRRQGGRHAVYPLSGVVICEHCGAPMTGQSGDGKRRYVCSTYRRDSRQCAHHAVDAAALLAWLVPKLQEIMTGPGRDELVRRTARRLRENAKGGDAAAKRLRKRLAELDGEIANLVKAVRRAADVDELIAELSVAKRERAAVADELDRTGSVASPGDATREAERRVAEVFSLAEVLGRADPATLRGVLRELVARIDCRWEPAPEGVRAKRVLVEGRVRLRPNPLLAASLIGADVEAS